MHVVQSRKSVGVVGGGIIGLSIAWRLAQAGFAVRVYERSRVGGEASWAGAGMLAPGGEFDTDSQLARLAIESRDLYPAFVEELERESSVDIDLQQTGALEVAYGEPEMTDLAGRAERQTALGIPSKRVQPEQIATFWPRLRREDLLGGYFYPGDAAVDPRHVVEALRVCCERLGVEFAEHTEVHSVAAGSAGTSIGDAQHDAAVVACGAWSGGLTVSGVRQLPASVPVRGHLVGYRQPVQTCNTIVRRGHTYLLQRANGFFIAGASEERVGFDRTISTSAAEQLASSAAFLMPHLGETTPTEVWNGFRPGGDGLQLGRWDGSPLYLAYGHYRNGILLAPVTAKLIAAEISASF